MYNEYYNLKFKPFQISSDPRFLWFGEKHKEALAILRYGILDNKGFLLLTGDVGTGKTSLINALVQGLKEDILCASVPDPNLERMDFFNYIASAFGINQEFQTKGGFLGVFRNFLMQASQNNKKVLLIIDEAQLLSQDMLEEIRLLSNIEKADAKLINIFFIGQNEFNEVLNRTQNRALRQRMTLNYNIEPLVSEEVDAYICHRLKVAGTTEIIFGQDAVQEIYLYSGGFPRRINILCDHSLVSGFVKDQRIIDAKIVRECARDLKIPAYVKNRTVNDFYDDEPDPSKESRPALKNQTAAGSPSAPSHPRAYTQVSPPPPVPVPPEGKRGVPWIEGLLLMAFAIFAWYFMFPEHFAQTTADLRYRIETTVQGVKDGGLPGFSKEAERSSETKPENSGLKSPSQIDNQSSNEGGQQDEQSKRLKETLDGSLKADGQDSPVVVVPVRPESRILPETSSIQNAPPGNNRSLKSPDALGETDEANPPEAVDSRSKEGISDSAESVAVENSGVHIFPVLPKDPVLIRFKYNANDFTDEGLEALNRFSKILAAHPEARIKITGHTDDLGSESYNVRLSEFRANIVKSYFLGVGVKNDQMEVVGMGGKNPIQSNETAWGRTMNRRVEIVVIQ